MSETREFLMQKACINAATSMTDLKQLLHKMAAETEVLRDRVTALEERVEDLEAATDTDCGDDGRYDDGQYE